jgi:hypothetical protein
LRSLLVKVPQYESHFDLDLSAVKDIAGFYLTVGQVYAFINKTIMGGFESGMDYLLL